MIRINNIQKVESKEGSSNYSKDGLVRCKDRQCKDSKVCTKVKDVVLTFLEVRPDLYLNSMVGRLLELVAIASHNVFQLTGR